MSERVCFRYRTVVLYGPWRRQAETAEQDAIGAGQVLPNGSKATWLVKGEIEASYCDKGGACGGQYPPDDDGRDASLRFSILSGEEEEPEAPDPMPMQPQPQ